MVLDISAYNKDSCRTPRAVWCRSTIRSKQAPVDIRVLTNADFGNARGIDIRLDRRFGKLFNGTLAYTFEQAKNTGSDPFTYINFGSRVLNAVSGGNNPPPQAILTTDPEPAAQPGRPAGPELPRQLELRFRLAGSIFQNLGVFATFRFASGTPYTRCVKPRANSSVDDRQPV